MIDHPTTFLDRVRLAAWVAGPGRKRLRSAFAWLAEQLDPYRDNGTGPLLRCQKCREVRRDISDDQMCMVCSTRIW